MQHLQAERWYASERAKYSVFKGGLKYRAHPYGAAPFQLGWCHWEGQRTDGWRNVCQWHSRNTLINMIHVLHGVGSRGREAVEERLQFTRGLHGVVKQICYRHDLRQQGLTSRLAYILVASDSTDRVTVQSELG